MKKSLIFLFAFVFLFAFIFSGCAYDNITITGSATYYSSTYTETSSVTVSQYNKVWNTLSDGLEPKLFTIKNNTETDFKDIEYRAAGYDNFEPLNLSLSPSGSCQIVFSRLTITTYINFEFRFKTNFDNYVYINTVDVSSDSGIELITLSGEYGFNYFKDMRAN